jgi:hypothetical protein
MKKNLSTLILVITLSLNGFTQFWQLTNEPAIGAIKNMYLVDTTAASLGNIVGVNQTWDFSALAAYEENLRVVSITDADDFPNFPNASHMLLIPGFMNTAYSYAAGTNDKMSHGYQFELPDIGEVIFMFDDFQKMLQFPSAFGATFTDNMSGTFTIFDEENDADGQTWVTADGTGTLILANGISHSEVLRIRTIDTLYADIVLSFLPIPTSVTIVRESYDYVKPGNSSFPLFTHATLKVLNAIIGQIKISVVLSSENPTNFVSIENAELSKSLVYPNPSNGVFTVQTGSVDASSVTIADVTGRVVFESQSTSNQIQVDLTDELPGIYFVNIIRDGIKTVEKVIIK